MIAIVALTACTNAARGPDAADVHPAPDHSSTEVGADSGRPRTGIVTVADGVVKAPYVQGRRFHNPEDGRSKRLGGRAHAPFTAGVSPAAVLDPVTETLLAYDSWRRGAPAIRVHDLRTDDDLVVDEGAFTLAWSDEGELAYFKGLDRRVRDPNKYRGHVIVRSSPDASPRRWSANPARYMVTAWAGDRLVVYRQQHTWTDVVVFDGPRRMRVLAEEAALVALSPDGSRAFIADKPDPRPIVRIVDLARGNEITRLSLAKHREPATGSHISYVAAAGSWTNDVIVAAVSGGIGVFRLDGNTIRVDQLLGLDPEVFPVGVTEPRADEAGRYIAASVELPPAPGGALGRTALIECDRLRLTCVRGPLAPYLQPPRVVYDPSRP